MISARHLRVLRTPLAQHASSSLILRRLASTTSPLSPQAANPPRTTRPPILDLPKREPKPPQRLKRITGWFKHVFRTGKAYLKFYKTGFSWMYFNARLVWAIKRNSPLPTLPANANPASTVANAGTTTSPKIEPDTPAPATIATSTRAHHQLIRRHNHDMKKLPIFGLCFIICGEFTPLVVLLLPHIVPYPCRIPRQVTKLQKAAEKRRAASFEFYKKAVEVAWDDEDREHVENEHIAKSLGFVSTFWDKITVVPTKMAKYRTEERIAALVKDDALIRQAGGVGALEGEEIVLACEERGLDTLDRDTFELRGMLTRWLRFARGSSEEEAALKIRDLLLKRPQHWE